MDVDFFNFFLGEGDIPSHFLEFVPLFFQVLLDCKIYILPSFLVESLEDHKFMVV